MLDLSSMSRIPAMKNPAHGEQSLMGQRQAPSGLVGSHGIVGELGLLHCWNGRSNGDFCCFRSSGKAKECRRVQHCDEI